MTNQRSDSDVIELGLIGEILQEPEIFNECILEISEKSFACTEAKRIFKAMIELSRDGTPIDALTTLNKLGGNESGYKTILVETLDYVSPTKNYKAHIQAVKEQSIRRNVFNNLLDIYYNSKALPLEDLQKQIGDTLTLFDESRQDRIKDTIQMHAEFLDWIMKNDDYIKTGIKPIDTFLKISKGDYIVVGGRPSSGKTALTLQIAFNMAKTQNVLYFSFETDTVKAWSRVVSFSTKTKFKNIKTKKHEKIDWQKINGFGTVSGNYHFKYIESAGMTTEQIRSIAIREKADVIFIDYLTLIRSDGKNLYEKATDISMDLHTIAQRDKIAIIALTQLNRQADKNEPSMADIRESGQIEQDADAILLLSPKDDVTAGAETESKCLYVAKNKEGSIGKINLLFNGDCQYFSNYD